MKTLAETVREQIWVEGPRDVDTKTYVDGMLEEMTNSELLERISDGLTKMGYR